MRSFRRTTATAGCSAHKRASYAVLALGLTLAGCAGVDTKTAGNTATDNSVAAGKPVIPPYTGGGYYKDDGPGANPPGNLAEIPDAVPKRESPHRYANNPYKVLGQRYVPLTDSSAYKSRGLASWYGRKFHGKSTSNGESYDMYAMSAAHTTLPLPSYARVTNLENGKSVVVRVNDRGPFHPGRIIDLSYTAAFKLDILKGVTPVEVEAISPDSAPTSFVAQSEASPVPAITPLAKVEPTPASPGKVIYLQLGAFGNPATADGVLARASAKLSGDFPSVMRLEINGLHKVQAGPFASTDSADRAAALIQQDLGIKTFKVLADAPAVVPTNAASNTAAGLYLQLAAVSSPAAAEALASRVKSRFGSELPGLNQVNAGNLFKLQAGPFATPAAAERIALAYQQDFGVKPYRVTR
ncbi:MAG: septal ring lytic transglycosylase RlpA family protein [Pseudomonadota bacterium]|nr:septal ring lytic transglycosylase RlpA family protein [Pseudomonadota bacterium]